MSGDPPNPPGSGVDNALAWHLRLGGDTVGGRAKPPRGEGGRRGRWNDHERSKYPDDCVRRSIPPAPSMAAPGSSGWPLSHGRGARDRSGHWPGGGAEAPADRHPLEPRLAPRGPQPAPLGDDDPSSSDPRRGRRRLVSRPSGDAALPNGRDGLHQPLPSPAATRRHPRDLPRPQDDRSGRGGHTGEPVSKTGRIAGPLATSGRGPDGVSGRKTCRGPSTRLGNPHGTARDRRVAIALAHSSQQR